MVKFKRAFLFLAVVSTFTSQALAEDSYKLPDSFHNSQGNATVVAQNKTQNDVLTKKTRRPEGAPPADWEAQMIDLQNQLNSLQTRFETLEKDSKEKKDSLSGYSGGFFLKSEDGNFKLTMNLGLRFQYTLGIGQEQDSSHGFSLNGIYLLFRGNAFTDKLSYSIYLAPSAPKSLGSANISYTFNDHFILVAGFQSLAFDVGLLGASSTTNQFISSPMAVARYGTASVGVTLTGEIVSGLSYGLNISNGNSGFDSNANGQYAYGGQFMWEPLGAFGSIAAGDSSHSKKPVIKLETGGSFSHAETGLEERVMMGSVGGGIKFLGINFYTQGFIRFVDPDDFTRQQIDASVFAQIGYFLVKDKFEIAGRYSALFDDINGANVNYGMAFGGLTGPGDPDGDSNDEHQFSLGMAYNIIGVKLRAQAEYTYWYDGRIGQDHVNHLATVRMHAKF